MYIYNIYIYSLDDMLYNAIYIHVYIIFFFVNGLIDDVIVIGWTDSDFKISRALEQRHTSLKMKGIGDQM